MLLDSAAPGPGAAEQRADAEQAAEEGGPDQGERDEQRAVGGEQQRGAEEEAGEREVLGQEQVAVLEDVELHLGVAAEELDRAAEQARRARPRPAAAVAGDRPRLVPAAEPG